MTRQIEDFFVPWLEGQKHYVSNHLELAWRDASLHRMMSNENPNPPSPHVMAAIEKYGAMANRYPDQGLVVRARIAADNGLAGPQNVLLGNGSSEVFDMVFRSFLQVGQEVIQHTPCFGIYKLRCAALGGKLVSVPMRRKDDLLHFDTDAILGAITDDTRIIVIANPNNPTGNFMDAADFVRIAETGIPFVIDEAYVEYAGLGMSQVGLISRFPNVMITRTLSKAYGLAGLRFGYLLAAPQVIERIAATLLPWNVGTIPMWAALAAFEDEAALAERVKANNDAVADITASLSDIEGLVILPSHSNYILMDGGKAGKQGSGMVQFAESHGIIFRPMAPMYDSEGWFRITIGTDEENTLAIQVIRDYFAQ